MIYKISRNLNVNKIKKRKINEKKNEKKENAKSTKMRYNHFFVAHHNRAFNIYKKLTIFI